MNRPKGQLETNLNASGENILVTVWNTDKIVWVDLKLFDIYVKDRFMVSLELLKVYGDKKLGLVLTTSFNQFGSMCRYAIAADKKDKIYFRNKG